MLTPAPHVHYAASEHGTALLDVRHGRWVMLDPDASRIWHAVTVRGGTAGLAEEIAVPTQQDPQAVQQQIATFLDELIAAGLLTHPQPRTPRSRLRGWWRR